MPFFISAQQPCDIRFDETREMVSEFDRNCIYNTFRHSDHDEINHSFNNNELTLYPNPAADVLNVKEKLKPGSKIYIMNNVGQKVKSYIYSEGDVKLSIDIHDLSSGIYFLKTAKNTSKFIKL